MGSVEKPWCPECGGGARGRYCAEVEECGEGCEGGRRCTTVYTPRWSAAPHHLHLRCSSTRRWRCKYIWEGGVRRQRCAWVVYRSSSSSHSPFSLTVFVELEFTFCGSG